MFDSVFPLLPYRGLDQSLLLPVLLGVLVLALLTELFGIAFVGVVVPGYLGAIAVAQPGAALGMVIEAVATYMIARAFSDGLRRSDVWTIFFGRERFYFIVLVSVFVRQCTQNWIFPPTSGWILRQAGLEAWMEGGVTSIGLVLVPLLANMFWKPGLLRGCWHIGLSVGATYFLVDALFLPYTNLSFSSLELTIESVAVDFMRSGKAYIVMLTATLIAAQFNLRYGWDFGGILVPGLLSIVWLDPIKVVTTTVEALVLAGLTAATMRLPGLRTLNFGGPRKLVLLFIIGFFVKSAIGWGLGESYPGMKATDLFGFGYLLPALLAVKILDRGVVVRVVAPAILTSWLGFVLGSAFGFGLQAVVPYEVEPIRIKADPDVAQGPLLPDRPYSFILEAAADARSTTTGQSTKRVLRTHLASRLARAVDTWGSEGGEVSDELSELAQRMGLTPRMLADPTPLQGSTLVLEPSAGVWRSSTFSALVRPTAAGPWLFVTHPTSYPWTAPASLAICAEVDCRGIVVAAIDEGQSEPEPSEMRAFAAALSGPTVFITSRHSAHAATAVIYVRGMLAGNLDLAPLLRHPPDIRWDPPPPTHEWLDEAADMVIEIPRGDLLRMIGRSDPALTSAARADVWSVEQWEDRPSPHYMRRIRHRALAALQLELERLSRAVIEHDADAIAASSAVLNEVGWPVIRFEDCDGQGPCWVLDLSETINIFIMIREGVATPLALFASGAGTEIGALPLARDTFSAEQAQILVWGDVAREPMARTVLDAVHNAVDRVLRDRPESLVFHIRGLADHRAMTDAILWATSRPILEEHQVPLGLLRLETSAGAIGPLLAASEPIDGSARFAGLLSVQTQSLFSRNVGGIDTAALWLGSEIRQQWRRKPQTAALRRAARGGVLLRTEVPDAIALDDLGGLPASGAAEAGTDFFGEVRRLSISRNVRLMRRLVRLAEESPDLELEFGWDPLRGRGWILAGERSIDRHERMLFLEGESSCEASYVVASEQSARRQLARAMFQGCLETTITWYGGGVDGGS